jgi:hypothetical protein
MRLNPIYAASCLKLYCRSLVCLAFLLVVIYLVFSTPSYLEKPCDPLLEGDIQTLCGSVINGDDAAVLYASKYSWCLRPDVLSDVHYESLLTPGSCLRFIQSNGYSAFNITKEELDFPIAFGILMHENVEQVIFQSSILVGCELYCIIFLMVVLCMGLL